MIFSTVENMFREVGGRSQKPILQKTVILAYFMPSQGAEMGVLRLLENRWRA
jgi:hypothetical protein